MGTLPRPLSSGGGHTPRSRVLVTGAGGQLATHLQGLAEGEHAVEWLFYPREALDITSLAQVYEVLGAVRPDWVVNAAAYTAVDLAERESELAFAVNAAGVGNLSKAASELGIRLLHISTDYVFTQEGNTPRLESDIPAPRGVYAWSKREGELRVLSSGAGMVLRTSWLYSRIGRNFYRTIGELLRGDRAFGVVYDQVGTPTWVGSLARAIASLVARDCYIPGVYHYTDLGVASWYDFAMAIHAGVGGVEILPIRTAEYPTPAPRPSFSVLDSAYSRRKLGLEAVHWTEALRQCMNEELKP